MADPEDTSTTTPTDVPRTSRTGKPKQTRRRQRLSCVECTRRRQKCDRQVPCGLCISRGVPHLCKWEPIVARPEPQCLPEGALVATQQHQSTIATLTARIAILEQIIVKQNLELTWGGSIEIVNDTSRPGPSSTFTLPERTSVPDPQPLEPPHETGPLSSSASAPPTPESGSSEDLEQSGADPALSRVDLEVQFAAAKMAQLTLAPPNEFVGAGTIFCAIHRLGGNQSFKYPYARSGPMILTNTLYPNDNPLATPISCLVASLPPRETVNNLIEAYYGERDWNFSLPERWFKTACQQMWDHLDTPCAGRTCQAAGGCSRCTREVNPNWLALLFAVLALAPHKDEGLDSKMFFAKAMEARRLVEDTVLFSRQYSSAPSQSVVHGVSLGCIAAALLACWLSDHGRPSDCWKLTGTAIRQAQAVGLHRDPTWYKWEKMDAQECELRVYAWWYLIISDRLNSMILGRPTMAGQGTFDVRLVPGAMHGDGSENPHVHYQQSFIALMEIVDEVVTNGLAILPRPYATVLETDKKFNVWYSKLHPSLDWRRPHATLNNPAPRERGIFYQRYISAAFFLGALMNLHRPYLMQAPPTLPLPHSAPNRVVQNPSREHCIETAMELVRVLCDAHEEALRWGSEPRVSSALFHYAYFIFDGGIALVGALSQDPPHPKAEECLDLIHRGMRILGEIKQAHDADSARRGETNIASRALSILAVFRKAGRWDERFGQKDRAARNAAPSISPAPSVAEPPVDLYGLGGLPFTGNPPFGPTQFSRTGFDTLSQPSTSTAVPFLSVDHHTPSMFPRSGPVNVQSLAMETGQCGDMRNLGVYMSMMTSQPLDLCGSRGVTQTMAMPFHMLHHSENDGNDIDWGAVMNSTNDTGAGGSLFIG